MESRVDLRNHLDESSRTHPPYAMLDGIAREPFGLGIMNSAHAETITEPQLMPNENPHGTRRRYGNTRWDSIAATRAEGFE